MQFWTLFPFLGSAVRHRSRVVAQDRGRSGSRQGMKQACCLAAGAMIAGFGISPTFANEVTITVTDLRSSEGVVRACMTTVEDIFPRCIKDPDSHRTVVPAGEEVTITFTDVAPGAYAIALLHDENDNGKADRALGMAPKEGYGFSRDAKVRLGPPKFKDAVFDMTEEPQQLTIKMRYFL